MLTMRYHRTVGPEGLVLLRRGGAPRNRMREVHGQSSQERES